MELDVFRVRVEKVDIDQRGFGAPRSYRAVPVWISYAFKFSSTAPIWAILLFLPSAISEQAPKFNLFLNCQRAVARLCCVGKVHLPTSSIGSVISLDMTSMSPTEKPVSKPILPVYSWRTQSSNPQLFYIRDHRQVDLTIARLRNGPLGFDLEWRPNFIKGQLENPVALVQLSNQDTILLIQISAMSGMFLFVKLSRQGLNYFENFLVNFESFSRILVQLKQESVFNVCVTL